VEGNDLHGCRGHVCEGDRVCVGVSHGMVKAKLLYFRWLSPFLKLMYKEFPRFAWNRQECSETWAYKIQMVRNYPEESIQHSEHSESLESRILFWIHQLQINSN
jgi:hypothetical protein